METDLKQHEKSALVATTHFGNCKFTFMLQKTLYNFFLQLGGMFSMWQFKEIMYMQFLTLFTVSINWGV